MTRNFNTNTDNHDEWLTPPGIIRSLGHFDLDPCAPIVRPWPTAERHFTIKDDGLSREWGGGSRVWCNPPYGNKTFEWIKKLADHGNGIALIFARTDTKGFHSQIWNRADAVFFFEGRLSFHRVDGTKGNTANAASCLVAYGRINALTLHVAGLKGKLVNLK